MARIYQAATMGEAHIRIAIVATREEADLLVHKVSSWGLARGDALWFVTRSKQDATAWIFPTSVGMADVKICFVDNFSEAGWQKSHPYKGKFNR
ncbi:MAG: hypothetical protein B0W54_16670 [Cellvibrio sp. 79]|nr:MAG: hypothetical protein B0W54_16670 [Cellvibrio sp. 79]